MARVWEDLRDEGRGGDESGSCNSGMESKASIKYVGVGGVFSGLSFVELEMLVGVSGAVYSLKR